MLRQACGSERRLRNAQVVTRGRRIENTVQLKVALLLLVVDSPARTPLRASTSLAYSPLWASGSLEQTGPDFWEFASGLLALKLL